jgi:metal-responsive CopG/Arc/MetJ family transcriptional regulator
MKMSISIPDDVFKTVDMFVLRNNISRSTLFTKAVTEFLSHHRQEDVTEQLNRVYSKQDSSLEPAVNALQVSSINICLE